MANEQKVKPQNWVTIGQYKINFILSFGVMRRYQLNTGKNPFTDPAFLEGNLGPVEIHALLWSFAQDQYPKITASEIDSLLNIEDPEQITVINTAIAKSVELSVESKKKSVQTEAEVVPPTVETPTTQA